MQTEWTHSNINRLSLRDHKLDNLGTIRKYQFDCLERIQKKTTTANPNVGCIEQETFCCRKTTCSRCGENRPSHLWKFSSPMNLNWKCNGSAFILPDICGAFDNCQRDGLGLSNRFHFWKHWHEKGSFSLTESHLTTQNIQKWKSNFQNYQKFWS